MLQFIRFKHSQTGVIQVMFQHPDGWQSTTGVVASESGWKAIGWVMEDKSQKHNKED